MVMVIRVLNKKKKEKKKRILESASKRISYNLEPFSKPSIEGDPSRRIERALVITDRGEEEETGNEATSKWMLTRETDRLLGATGGWKRLRIRGETRRAVFSTLFSCSPLKKRGKKRSHQPRTRFSLYQLHCDDNDIPRRNTRHILFRREEFLFIVFVSRRRSRKSVNAPRLPLGIGRIPRACSSSRSRNFSWIGVIGRLCQMSMDFRAFLKRESEFSSWKLRIFSQKLFEFWNGTC